MKHQSITTGSENLSFGHGQHACPGRFFASNEIKVLLVEMLKRYDLALTTDGSVGTRPTSVISGISFSPDRTAKVHFGRDVRLQFKMQGGHVISKRV